MLRRELRANQYELIITHTTLASFWTRLAVSGLKKPPYIIDEDGLVNAVMRLVTDKQLQRSMGCAGYAKSAGYTIDSVLPIVMKEYLTFTEGQNEKNC